MIEEGWHVYSHDNDPLDGPIPTAFTIATEGVEAGELRECTPEVHYDPNFDKDVKSFEGTVRWALDVSWSGDRPEKIDGLLTYMTCDDTKCIFPPDVEFYLALDDALTEAVPELCPGDAGTVTEAEDDVEMGDGLFVLFLLGMGLGFAALFTPCVFPLIPMTVSFFTKQSKTRAEGIRNALIYGASIIFIYTGLGLLLTAVFGVDVLNVISTDPLFNVFLFALLLVFGFSFLGAFEIQLPSSWANKADQASDRGGILGIFFMAATLAIVSFSCTGPLVGSALAGAATGSFAAPTAVMLGFSIALAMPFGLFAVFPGWLNSLPQSGGWLNSVKVVLGLVEIGFAFKFLSNADLVLQLGLIFPLVAVCPPLRDKLRAWAVEEEDGIGDLYLLEVPMLKFALHFPADATLAVGLTALAAGAAPLPAPVLLLFAAGSLRVEAGQLIRAGGGGEGGGKRGGKEEQHGRG